MARHVIGVIVGSVAVVACLGGCILPIDAAKPTMRYVNDSSQDVVVIVEGLGGEFPMPVASKGSYHESIPECEGTALRVETEGGEVLGRIDTQACPYWTLTINKNGSLDYVEDK